MSQPSDRRSALGDVTNLVPKRPFSVVTDGFNKDVPLAKKVCLKLDNCNSPVLRPHSSREVKVQCVPDVPENAVSKTEAKVVDVVRDSCDGIVDLDKDNVIESVVVPEIVSKEKVENGVWVDVGDDNACFDNVDSSKDEFVDCSRFPESQESRFLESQESRCGVERCVVQKGDGVSSMGMDLIKACSCSFCVKAAYLWSDLHYQDMKGRIAAIKKSQKEAAILVHQNSRDGARDIGKFSNLESNLTGRWKSLFLHMEDVFVRESTQLETSLSVLKELRDNCKTDSEKK